MGFESEEVPGRPSDCEDPSEASRLNDFRGMCATLVAYPVDCGRPDGLGALGWRCPCSRQGDLLGRLTIRPGLSDQVSGGLSFVLGLIDLLECNLIPKARSSQELYNQSRI